MFTLIEAAAMK